MFIHTIAPFSFINQNGKTITNKNVEGRIYVANFFFTNCTSICPKMMNNLKKVQQAFSNNKDVLILSHSVLPETDSISRLAAYANKFGISSRQWWLLTGNKDQIYKLARKSYFADEEIGYNKNSTEFLHTENCILVDKKERIRGVYNGTLELEMNKLIEHIKILQLEE
jgi:protein SCO1/2